MGGDNSSDEPIPRWVQLICGAVCISSVLGSLAIILTYGLVKDIRSKARELLVHISVMDLLYSVAYFVGLAMPYDKYLSNIKSTNKVSEPPHHETYSHVCRAQAFIAVYGTVGSVLWTLALAVYLYYRIVSRDATVTRRLVIVLYAVCYVLPLYVSLWLLLGHHLGYSNDVLSKAGWCFANDISMIEIFMTYDIWLWLGIMILIPLYVTIYFHTKHEVCMCIALQNALLCFSGRL